jgi:hypothetical protein
VTEPTLADSLWADEAYRERIGILLAAMRLLWPMTATLDQVVEYKAHLTLFRMHGGIDEHLFTEGMKSADTMQQRIADVSVCRSIGTLTRS